MPTEFEIIDRFFTGRGPANEYVDVGIGDDAAILRIPDDRRLVAATDTVVSGVHFPAYVAPRHIGYRALAVNLSDLAAMGAEPFAVTLALTIPDAEDDWLQEFANGFFALAERFDVALVGGDLSRGPLSVTIQIMGLLPLDAGLTRSGASVGDSVWVTGTLGDASAGLYFMEHEGRVDDSLARRFLEPEPRIVAGRQLLRAASAAIDVSDGLHQDLGQLAKASGVGIEFDLNALPVSEQLAALGPKAALNHALRGGDDYELCFTTPDDSISSKIKRNADTEFTRIGTVVTGNDVTCFLDGQIVSENVSGYEHFSRGHEN